MEPQELSWAIGLDDRKMIEVAESMDSTYSILTSSVPQKESWEQKCSLIFAAPFSFPNPWSIEEFSVWITQ